jgi:hypothetical protein
MPGHWAKKMDRLLLLYTAMLYYSVFPLSKCLPYNLNGAYTLVSTKPTAHDYSFRVRVDLIILDSVFTDTNNFAFSL